jgi:predicted amidohydrolase
MKICVTYATIKEARAIPKCDVAIFPFHVLGEVDYESELSGKSEKCEELARLSKQANCAALCGCITNSRGLKRKSVAVADRGKLLGICDMLNVVDGEDFKSGGVLGAFSLGGYKVGVCIENDLYFPDIIKSLSLLGCNLITVHAESLSDNIPPLIIRAYAYLYGVPIVMCAGKISYFADISGEIASSSQKISLYESDPKNYYRVISCRRRGMFNDFTHDY